MNYVPILQSPFVLLTLYTYLFIYSFKQQFRPLFVCYPPPESCMFSLFTRLSILLFNEWGTGTSRIWRRRITGHTGRMSGQGEGLDTELHSQLSFGPSLCENKRHVRFKSHGSLLSHTDFSQVIKCSNNSQGG